MTNRPVRAAAAKVSYLDDGSPLTSIQSEMDEQDERMDFEAEDDEKFEEEVASAPARKSSQRHRSKPSLDQLLQSSYSQSSSESTSSHLVPNHNRQSSPETQYIREMDVDGDEDDGEFIIDPSLPGSSQQTQSIVAPKPESMLMSTPKLPPASVAGAPPTSASWAYQTPAHPGAQQGPGHVMSSGGSVRASGSLMDKIVGGSGNRRDRAGDREKERELEEYQRRGEMDGREMINSRPGTASARLGPGGHRYEEHMGAPPRPGTSPLEWSSHPQQHHGYPQHPHHPYPPPHPGHAYGPYPPPPHHPQQTPTRPTSALAGPSYHGPPPQGQQSQMWQNGYRTGQAMAAERAGGHFPPPPEAMGGHYPHGPDAARYGMMRSYSDPFVHPPHPGVQRSQTMQPRHPGPYPYGPHPHEHGQPHLPHMIPYGPPPGTIAMGAISSSSAFQTPAKDYPGQSMPGSGSAASATGTSPMDSEYGSAKRPYSTSGSGLRRGAGGHSSTSGSVYSASGLSYIPSAEKEVPLSAANRRGNRRIHRPGMDYDDEDDDDYANEDEEDMVRQSSPTRAGGRGASAAPIKPLRLSIRAGVKGTATPPPPPSALPAKPPGKKASTAGKQPDLGPKEPKLDEPENVPAGPRSKDKPTFSYAAIIGQAILASSGKRLTLASIYAWITAAYPFFNKGDPGWMNSIRHNLSLNECFVKAERSSDVPSGKGSFWMIKPQSEYQFEGGGFKKGTGKGKPLTSTALSHSKKKGASASKPRAASNTPTQPPSPLLSQSPAPPPLEPSPILTHIKPEVAPPVETEPVGLMTRKRKGMEADIRTVEVPSKPLFQQHELTSPVAPPAPPLSLDDSPMLASAGVAKRPRLDKNQTTSSEDADEPMATPKQPTLKRMSSGEGVGIMEVEDKRNARAVHGMAFRQVPTSSPSVGFAPTRFVVDKTSPESGAESATSKFAPPAVLIERAGLRSHRSRVSMDDDDFVTPQKPFQLGMQAPSSSAYSLPHLTPSASSPVSSPAPATVLRGRAIEYRRSHMYQAANVVSPGDGQEDADVEIRRNESGDSDSSEMGIQESNQKGSRKVNTRSHGDRLGPAVVFATPAIPLKARTVTNPAPSVEAEAAQTVSMEPFNEHITLSPMVATSNHHRNSSVGRLNLPGPSELLLSSPRASSRREARGDLLNHLDRLTGPTSPIGRTVTNAFATPNGAARQKISTGPRQSTTPLRSSAMFGQLSHETPFGNTKMQFKAEHGIFESPNGLMGSCYDYDNPGYLVDQEIERLRASTALSPTGAHGKKGSLHAVYGKMLFENHSSP